MDRGARPLAGKTVVLGVAGSIAAFKAPHIVTRLVALGAEVVVVMTENATKFVTPLTFETLSGKDVIESTFSEGREEGPGGGKTGPGGDRLRHVRLADAADLAIVAPATANIIGKMAGGIADDFLSTELMAFGCPVIVAPAMNVRMMRSPAVAENLEKLRRRGVIVLEGGEGRLASGAVGEGRLADPDRIVEVALDLLLPEQDLAGRRVVVTAGPTREPIDPVRHVANRSTGRMGYSIAERAVLRGAEVVLVSGPSVLEPPAGARLVRVTTTREMRDAVMTELPEADLLVMAAAPSDYRPVMRSPGKIKKHEARITLDLERTEDILSEVAAAKRKGQAVVGFALETEDEIENARAKLAAKGLDLIVVNNPLVEGAGFEAETNVVTLIGRSGREESPGLLRKIELADVVLSWAAAEAGWGAGDE